MLRTRKTIFFIKWVCLDAQIRNKEEKNQLRFHWIFTALCEVIFLIAISKSLSYESQTRPKIRH